MIAVLALACAPTTVHAAPLAVVGDELVYTATPGDLRNSVLFDEEDPDTVRVFDFSPADPVVAGAGCSADPLTTDNDYVCDGVASVTATGDGGSDFLSAWSSSFDGTTTTIRTLETIPIAIDGGDVRDIIHGGQAGGDEIDGGDGGDTISSFSGNDTARGGAGNDFVSGDSGDDEVHGGPGWDYVAGGFGTDRLYGEEGTDELDGHSGPDLISGGSEVDIVYYNDTLTDPRAAEVNVTLDDVANDGGPGEGDDVRSDVENARGGHAADSLTGSAAGPNAIIAGGGDDTVDLRDSHADHASCGDGVDTVYADSLDELDSDCELVNPREPAPPAITRGDATPEVSAEPSTDARLAARGLLVRARPARDRRAPYTFLIKGLVRRPAGTAGAICGQGRVSIAVEAGRRVLTAVSEEVRSNCTFKRWFVFRSRRHFPRSGRLLVNLRFSGSQGLKPGNKARKVLRTR